MRNLSTSSSLPILFSKIHDLMIDHQCSHLQMQRQYNNKMSSKSNLPPQIVQPNNPKPFDPSPSVNGFGLFSSQQRSGQDHHEYSIQQLSNVEEKSYFSSEPELPDHLYIQNFLGKMRQVEGRQLTQQAQPNTRSRRIEDQEIIVVEEENQVGSNPDNNESLILEHIEFANELHPENTPEWEHELYSKEDERRSRFLDTSRKRVEDQREKGWKDSRDLKGAQEKEGDTKYVINLVPESQLWGNDNFSNSTPYDFQSSGFKLNPSRNSKNTCIDRSEPLDMHPDRIPANKSCIEKPLKFDEERPENSKIKKFSSSPSKGKDIQHILERWHEELYPQLQNQYNNGPSRRSSAEFRMERDAKFCHSAFEEKPPSTPACSRQAVMPEQAENEVQTDLTGEEILQNEKYLSEEIAQMRSRNQKLQEEVRSLREILRSKETELESAKNAQKQAQELSSGDEAKKLSSRNKELQRIITLQNETIKQYQERQETLEKKLHKTVSYHTLASTPQDRSPSFFGGQFQPMKLNKLHTFGMEDSTSHIKCRRETQELQEYIFDLEQKIAGIDIQVQRRVRILSQAVQQEIEDKENKEVQLHREETNKLKEAIKGLEDRLKQTEQKSTAKERELQERESEVNRMHEELLKEWNQIKRRSSEKKPQRHRTEARVSNSNTLSPITALKSRFDFDRLPTLQSDRDERPYPSRRYYPSSTELKPPSVFSRDRLNYPKKSIDVCNKSVSYLPSDQLSLSFRKPNHSLKETEKFSSSFTRTLGEENVLDKQEKKWGRGDENRVLRGQKWTKEPIKPQSRDIGELSFINSKIQRLRKEINRELCSFHP